MAVNDATKKAMMSLVELLEPLDSAERRRCISAALMFLGEDEIDGPIIRPKNGAVVELRPPSEDSETLGGDSIFGEKTRRWMLQHKISETQLQNVFHIDGSNVELIADTVPGRSRREKTINCYLLVGLRNFLRNDEPRFADRDAIEFCQITQTYDKNNHTTHRQTLSNRVSGDRQAGFVLTVPGLRDVAQLIKEMTNGDSQ